jgi:hypothetical protein
MDNAAATPRINPVSIPIDWCPKGNWQKIFTEYQNRFLSAAGVEFPGFGSVTPATLAQIEGDIAALQQEIANLTAATSKAYRSGNGVLTPSQATQTVSITLSPAMPSTNYDIGVMVYAGGGTNAAQSWAIDGAKATGGFTLRFNGSNTYTSFEWWVRER